MKRAKPAILWLIALAFAINPLSAMAQFTPMQPSQGYNNNQGYNQGYYQDYNQGYNQNYNQGYNQGYQGQQSLPPLQGSVMVAPAGTSLAVTTTTAVSSEMNNVGDPFSTRLSNDLYVGGGLVLPAGSIIEGQISSLTNAGRTGRNGSLGIRFTNAITPNGQRVPISARIATEDGTGIIKGGSTGGRVGKTFLRGAGGAAAGAALGTALAPAAGGRVGRGAVYGTAIGGGIGLLSTLVAKGKEAMLPSGTPLQIILDQPFTVQGSGSYQQGGYQNYNNNYGSGYSGGYGNY
ncbi:MAG: hypothetical protein AB1782_13700 [Cyanobacteriota bacterium]